VRRLTAWIGGVAGGITTYRWLRRRSQAAAGPIPEAPPDPDGRAEELREKLAESRAAEPVAEEAPPEPAAEAEPAPEPESPEDRRRRVHDEGRATLDEMKPDQSA
jgi:hypothetical protein